MTLPDITFLSSEYFSFYQIMGWIAVCFYVASFQCLDPKKTILLWIPANSIMSIHYFGLGSETACALAVGAIFRDLVAVYGSKKYVKIAIFAFTVYIWTAAFFLGSHTHDYLITLGTMFTGVSALYRDHFWKQRFFSFLQQIILFSGFYLLGSYPAMAFVTLTFSSNIIGIVRKLRVQG